MEKVNISNIEVIEELRSNLPMATISKNGLMSANFYTHGRRYTVTLSGENTDKCVCICKLVGIYKRVVINLFGIFEYNPINIMIGITTYTGIQDAKLSIKNIVNDNRVEFYKKIVDDSFYLLARSKGASGNPCFLQLNSIGDTYSDTGAVYEYDDSYTKIDIP